MLTEKEENNICLKAEFLYKATVLFQGFKVCVHLAKWINQELWQSTCAWNEGTWILNFEWLIFYAVLLHVCCARM